MCPCVADRIEFGSVGKTGVPKTTGRTIKGENQQQTQASYGVDGGSRTRATLVNNWWEAASAHTTAPALF